MRTFSSMGNSTSQYNTLPQSVKENVEQNVEQKVDPNYYKTLNDDEIKEKPMVLRCKYDPKRVPILHSVILINVVLCVSGIFGALSYLNLLVERFSLSICYSLLFVFASLNQGLIDRWYEVFDIIVANAIFLLNLFFYLKEMSIGILLYGAVLLVYFFWYFYNAYTMTVRVYEFHTNVWHLGVIVLVYLVPFSLNQNNLF